MCLSNAFKISASFIFEINFNMSPKYVFIGTFNFLQLLPSFGSFNFFVTSSLGFIFNSFKMHGNNSFIQNLMIELNT